MMNKRRIAIIAMVFVAVLVALTINGCGSKDDQPVSMGELDKLEMLALDGTKLEFTKSDLRGSLIAVVYNPGCDHCQTQAQEFYQNMDKLEDVTIIMIGSVPMDELKDFSEKYGLKNFKNVKFAYASPVNTFNLLRVYDLPHMRLYNKELLPIREFTSTTSVDHILSFVKK
ncbi:MAG TPA: hypothetical protein DIS90_01805 [Cytophagales bacterium]|nr:hypothetical protein [Cytophagales bacterium]HCR53454.1 hypothetical protein [Cytophagales bacterium]